MPIEITRLTSELDEALNELRGLKEYIANLNIADFRKRLSDAEREAENSEKK